MSNQENYIGYEYKQVKANFGTESLWKNSMASFGWEYEGTTEQEKDDNSVKISFRRNRKIRNKAELSRLQRQFEACVREIETLEHSKTSTASIVSFSIGLVGTAFLAGSVFVYLGGMMPLMVILAIPGFLGWVVPYFSYHRILQRKADQIAPIIEQKNDEIDTVCEQGCHLLTA